MATRDRKVRRTTEHASLGARRERDVTEPSHSFQKWVLEERIGAGGGNEPDPRVSQSDESHAKSRCEQQERGGTHHSTREVALCVGGTRDDDESEAKHCRQGSL